MKYVIAYDVSDDKIRRRVVKYLESFSYRVQGSVFLCSGITLNTKYVKSELLRLISSDAKARVLLVSLSDAVKENIWFNEEKVEVERPSYYWI